MALSKETRPWQQGRTRTTRCEPTAKRRAGDRSISLSRQCSFFLLPVIRGCFLSRLIYLWLSLYSVRYFLGLMGSRGIGMMTGAGCGRCQAGLIGVEGQDLPVLLETQHQHQHQLPAGHGAFTRFYRPRNRCRYTYPLDGGQRRLS